MNKLNILIRLQVCLIPIVVVAAYSTLILSDLDLQQVDTFAEDVSEGSLYNPLGYNGCGRGKFRYKWMREKEYDSFICLKNNNQDDKIRQTNGQPTRDTNSSEPHHRIHAGFLVQPGEFPSYVQVVHLNITTGELLHCGGILLNRYLVLTAAHCLPTRRATVYAGSVENLKGKSNRVRRACLPDKFDTKNTTLYDWAILELLDDYKYNANIRPACLNLDFKMAESVTCVVVGNGRVSPTSGLSERTKGAVLMDCVKGGQFESGMRCMITNKQTGAGAGQGCPGDSGGPLYCFENCSGRPRMYSVGLMKGSPDDIYKNFTSCNLVNRAYFTYTLSHRLGMSKLIQIMVRQRRMRREGKLAGDELPPTDFVCESYRTNFS